MMSPFSRQDPNLCLLSLAFIIDLKFVSVRAWSPTGLISRGLGQGQTVPECGPSNQSKCYAIGDSGSLPRPLATSLLVQDLFLFHRSVPCRNL